MGKFIDLTGKKFGRLTVIKRGPNKGTSVYWFCQCDCGAKRIIRGDALKQGKTKSCGCLQKDVARKIRLNSRICKKEHYRLRYIYDLMKSRCYYVRNIRYNNYGGRGITVCDEWKNDFKVFYNWAITNGYKENLTIDRIDNNGNYEPSNCRWVDMKTQQNNKSNNYLVTYNNETHTVAEWSKITGLKESTLHMRLKNYKWTVEMALTTPVRNRCFEVK